MRKRVYLSIILFAMLALVAQASQITLSDFSVSPVPAVMKPIGIDYHEPNGGNLIVSARYPTGLPSNLNLIQVPGGSAVDFGALSGLTD